jgi:hypothetical protein
LFLLLLNPGRLPADRNFNDFNPGRLPAGRNFNEFNPGRLLLAGTSTSSTPVGFLLTIT